MDVARVQSVKVMGPATGGWWVGDRSGAALLSAQEAPEGIERGQQVEVFVLPDRDGLLRATLRVPSVQRGGFAALRVVAVVGHGAYLDWGMDRDLFVPHGLMHRPLSTGDLAVVAVDVDGEGRVFGSTRLAPYLQPARQLAPGTEVTLLVYGDRDVGTQVVVDGRYGGLVYHSTTFRPLAIGEVLTGWVTRARQDGRVDVALQRVARAGTEDAREVVWQRLMDAKGFLPLTDRSDAETIHAALQMSKKAFKKAVGSLYKARRITLEPHGIRVVEDPE